MENLETIMNTDTRYNAENLIFALDIGTRSVIGVVGAMEGDKFKIVATETVEHEKRAMIDGQIEDISAVSAVAAKVKARLEARIGGSLRRVCVAAAGRALKTSLGEYSMTLSPQDAITQEKLYELEMGAVSRASETIAKTESSMDFYCVGYSVRRYYLDDYVYSTLLDHKGRQAKVEIIATFLPREVVESLSSAMTRIGLEIDFLTLEPIAAMNAVIPSELRLLNLALVDIGAGTSDIALCEESTVTAYTMATIAGDEITEAIIRTYLVDFATAEQIKHKLSEDTDQITFTDVVGMEYTVARKDVIAAVTGVIEHLSNVICERIVECNGRSPSAVFLVGGGSKVPLLCDLIADRLSLDRRKVAVGGNNFMKRVVVSHEEICGPEYATPLGIALTAAASGDSHGFSITINGEKRQLFRSSAMTLMDVLLLCGYKYSDILGKNGRSIEYELNGNRCICRGEHLKPATLKVNGVDVNITAPIKSGDMVEIAPAESGGDATLRVGQFMASQKTFEIIYDGSPLVVGSVAIVNGVPVEADYEIQNKDKITVEEIVTLDDLYRHKGISPSRATLLVNGAACDGSYILREGDRIAYFGIVIKSNVNMFENSEPEQTETQPEPQPEPVYTAPAPAPFVPAAPAPVVEQPVIEEDDLSSVMMEIAPPAAEEPVRTAPDRVTISVTINGKPCEVELKPDNSAPLFVDMFNYVDIDPAKPDGDIVLLYNGVPASYVQPIQAGDVIDIYWSNSSRS